MNSNYYVIVKSNNRTGKVGMASIRDVARRAGVGVGTVSRVINGTGYVSADTRKKIESAIEELQYKPNELARNLFRNKTGIVGILVPDVDHPFFSSYVRQTEAALYEMGYKTLIGNTIGISNREREFLDMLDRNMVDGIITGSHTLEGDEYLKRKKTIVSLDRDFGSGIPMVGSDHMSGGEMAANILIKNKCKKVLNISGVAPDIAANDRHAILETILTEHGVEVIDVIMDPSFGPVRTDHSLLISGRGSPLSSSLTDAETGESDISDSFTFRIEAVSSYTDLNIFFIGIFFMEVCINNCLIIGFILFCVPCIYREIRIP